MAQKEYPCPSCGAALYFDPARQALHCNHCGHDEAIPQAADRVRELDYLNHLSKLSQDAVTTAVLLVKCTSCGAQTSLAKNVTASRCPFCDSAIVTQAATERLIEPQSLLPFAITRKQAHAAYIKWLAGLWFAPNSLKKMASIEDRLNGLYVPFWTYDSDTYSDYTGQRGDDYWESETYTVMVDGKSETRTRQVLKTRWYYVSGNVSLHFNDVLVLASRALPMNYTDALEPWDLRQLTPFDPGYLSGFVAQSYQVDLPTGFEIAKEKMDPHIRQRICQDIGGDHQRISSVNTTYDEVTFKHLLLPIWLASYRYKNTVYRFLVNARTGEVQGQRPWSYWKIAFAVLAGLALVAVIALIIASQQQ